MGRVSQAQAQENRQRVIAAASRMFRDKGTGVSVADVMNAAGLTHGGFYKQFASKEDLIDEATAHAFSKPAVYAADRREDESGQLETDRRALIEQYLSPWHRDHAANGCPVSGFAADLGREPDQAAHAHRVYTQGVRRLAARLANGDDDGLAQLCTLVGALTLARATQGDPLSDELLQAARTALTQSGTGESEPHPHDQPHNTAFATDRSG